MLDDSELALVTRDAMTCGKMQALIQCALCISIEEAECVVGSLTSLLSPKNQAQAELLGKDERHLELAQAFLLFRRKLGDLVTETEEIG